MAGAALPEQFGKYVLVERLGAGGMAEVFRAVMRGDGGFEKQVALKRVLASFEDQDDFVALFGDEARIVAALNHTNVCQVFDFGEVGGVHYLAMELVEGLDLGHLVDQCEKQGQPFPHASAAFVIAEAARGLDYAHQRKGPDGQPLGIVHRDVSPQNLLVSTDGEVKLTDFGIAKAQGKRHRTATGVVMGKLRYMSPEQVVGALALDGRSDIFALGVILFELLVGGPVFENVTAVRAAELLHTQDAPKASSRRADVPAELDRIVGLALARDREQRYARAADLARDLSRWLAGAAPGFAREDLGALVARMMGVRQAERAARAAARTGKQAKAEDAREREWEERDASADTEASPGPSPAPALVQSARRGGTAFEPTRPMKLAGKTTPRPIAPAGEPAATSEPIALVNRKSSKPPEEPPPSEGRPRWVWMVGIGAAVVLVLSGAFIVYRVMYPPGSARVALADDAALPDAGGDGALPDAGALTPGADAAAARADGGPPPDADDGTVDTTVTRDWKKNDHVDLDGIVMLHVDRTILRPEGGIRRYEAHFNFFATDDMSSIRFLLADDKLRLIPPSKVTRRDAGRYIVSFQLLDDGNPTQLIVERGQARARIRLN